MKATGFSALERLHEGGQAIIYRARRVADGRPVVLKMLRGPYPTPAQRTRFRDEHALTCAVAGPGVVAVEGWLTEGDIPVLVLEDFGAQSLDRIYADGPPSLARAVEIAIAIVGALLRVHERRVLHLDINPSNIVVSPDDGALKLIDFGLSTDLPRQSAALRSAQVLQGTLRFVSPEQTGRMNRSVDYRSDYYSLGATLYWLLTGRPPFTSVDPLELVHAHIARRPEPASAVAPAVPLALSTVAAKLLEKSAGDRYQSARGILADLERCRAIVAGEIDGDGFVAGQHDRSAQFSAPEALYGREGELDALLLAFERAAAGGREVALVQGGAGMGKTSLVRELQRALVSRGAFVTGKFDQFKRDIPYSSLAQALQQFVRVLLAGQLGEVEPWRARMAEAIAPNGQLLVELIPGLELVLPPQPPVPALPPLESEGRLHRTVRRFMRVLASAERPLALFMDDLQWADRPSLELLRVLATDPGGGHVLLLGAYRDNEVGAGHPLRAMLEVLGATGAPPRVLSVGPLAENDVAELLADALRCAPEDVAALAALCREKTGGNPFFLRRFLQSLADGGLLTLDDEAGAWRWELQAIAALDVTDNVIDFLATGLDRLPEAAQRSIEAAAVIGGEFEVSALADVRERSFDDAIGELDAPLRAGLIEEIPAASPGLDRRYQFTHDRIQQAAYERAPAEVRRRLHWRIGQRLLIQSEAQGENDALFDLVNHLNAGVGEYAAPAARARLVELDLRAGLRALSASAYAPAARYLQDARELLGPEGWSTRPALTREVVQAAARAAYLTNDYPRMEALVEEAIANAGDELDRIRALRVRIDALIAQNRNADAVAVGLDALGLLGVELPRAPGPDDVGAALGATFARLEGVDLSALAGLPPPEDPTTRLAMELVCTLAPPAYFINQMLVPLLGVELVRMTVERGPAPESAYGFSLLGLVLCDAGHIDEGYAFGQLGWGLAGRFDDRRLRVRAGHIYYGFCRHWKEPAPAVMLDYAELFDLAADIGEFEYAGYAGMMHTIFGFYTGADLSVIADSARFYSEAMRETRQKPSLAVHGVLHQAILNLQGAPDDPIVLAGEVYDEAVMHALFESLQDSTSMFVLHCVKGVVAGYCGEWRQSVALFDLARRNLHGAAGLIHKVVLEQWDALACLALAREYSKDSEAREALLARAEASLVLLDGWASHNPAGHGHRPVLVRAELASARGDLQSALSGFERAARAARDNLLVNDEAIALQRAGEACLEGGLTTAARGYLIEARYAWERWGAHAIARGLTARHPGVLGNIGERPDRLDVSGSMTTTGSLNIDALAVVRASQAIAKELEIGRLVEIVVQIAMEVSGAARCLVVGDTKAGLIVTAQGVAEPAPGVSRMSVPLRGSGLGPEGVVQYVARTREEVVLDDAAASELFASDPQVSARGIRSVLCLPIEQQGRLLAVLYLEHAGTRAVFTPQRVALLRVLLSQAAISVENATLIETLEQKVLARTAELASARERAESASAAKSAFLRFMSHELRTPLNAVLGYAQMLLDGGELSGNQQESVSTIQRSGRHLLSLINDVLDLSKIEAGKIDLEVSPSQLTGLVEEVVSLCRPTALAGVSLTVWSDPELPDWVETDARRLRQIVLNLLGNAVKFTSSGSISVRAERTASGGLQVSVEDTGPGVPLAKIESIFEPFEQAGDARQRARGTGLGLAISRRIARVMGGELTAESALGVGSTFTLRIPLIEVERPARAGALTGLIEADAEQVLPERAALEVLEALALEGDLSGLIRQAAALAGGDTSLDPFATRLMALAKDYDDLGVEKLLTEALEATAAGT